MGEIVCGPRGVLARFGPEDQRASSTGRLPALDGIRGLAIIWVVLHNTTDLLPPALHGPSHVLAFLVHPGWFGVQLFFALSGFLITGGLLEQCATNYFRAFYARRALRILPLYYTVLILLLIVAPALHLRPTLLQTSPEAFPRTQVSIRAAHSRT
jgi:peptidoglycan/LPS O-acetylase OafA/YrhL